MCVYVCMICAYDWTLTRPVIYVGTIPAALGGLHRLRRLDLSGNSLTGSIPARLTQLTSLQELLLQGNQLTGSLPEAIGQLAALTSLQLQHNHFQGIVYIWVVLLLPL